MYLALSSNIDRYGETRKGLSYGGFGIDRWCSFSLGAVLEILTIENRMENRMIAI